MQKMKLWIRLWIIIALGLISCTRVIDEEVGIVNQTNSLKVMTRSDIMVAYPLALFAFDGETGEMCGMTKANDASDELLLNLPQGTYRLSIVGGMDECHIPSVPTLDDVLTLPSANRLSSPLQMGMGDVVVTKQTTVNVMLYHQVAAIDMSLSDIPANVEAVSVCLSLLGNKLSLSGNVTGSVSSTVDLVKQKDGSWAAPTFYVLPTSTQKLTLSITVVTDDDERETYSYTYNGSLKANTPYLLVGSFQHGFSVNGQVSLAGWHERQEVFFSFGDGGGSEGGNGDTEPGADDNSGDDEMEVDDIPEAGTMWQGHFVGAVDSSSNSGTDILLLSLGEWRGVPSLYNSESPGMAQELVSSYDEEGLSGWTIPTKEEAKLIRESIGNNKLEETNAFLASQDIVGLSDNLEDEEGNMVRYLCEEAKLAYVWDVSTSNTISKGGSKRTYYLRAIKRVRISEK